MEVLDIIKQLCKEKNISLSQLEQALEYGNGSIAKSKGNMSADRMFQIAKYFKVPMEYLMTGTTITEADDDLAIARQQQSILLEISKLSQILTDSYKTIDKCKDDLLRLKSEYNKLEIQRHKKDVRMNLEDGLINPADQIDLFDLFSVDEQLPLKIGGNYESKKTT